MSEDQSNTVSKLKRIFLNKYAIVLVFFAVFLVFFDNHNLISRWESGRKISQLEKEAEFYRKDIESNKRKMSELQSNNENLEKFAREQYLMKKENEEIFIIRE